MELTRPTRTAVRGDDHLETQVATTADRAFDASICDDTTCDDGIDAQVVQLEVILVSAIV